MNTCFGRWRGSGRRGRSSRRELSGLGGGRRPILESSYYVTYHRVCDDSIGFARDVRLVDEIRFRRVVKQPSQVVYVSLRCCCLNPAIRSAIEFVLAGINFFSSLGLFVSTFTVLVEKT